MKRKHQIAIGVVVVLGGLGFGVVRSWSSAYDRAMARAKALGLPLRPEDVTPNLPPPSENAAGDYRAATAKRKLIPTDDRNIGEVFDPGLPELELKNHSLLKTLGTIDSARVDRALAQWASAFKDMEAGARKPKLVWNRDWKEGAFLLLPEYAELKNMTRAMLLDADRRFEKGDRDGGIKRLEQVRTLAHQIGQEPILLGKLVEISVAQLMLRKVSALMYRHRSDETAVRDLRNLVMKVNPTPMTIPFRGQLYAGLRNVDLLGRDPADFEDLIQSDVDSLTFQSLRLSSVRQTVKTRLLEGMIETFDEVLKAPEDWEVTEKAFDRHDGTLAADNSLPGKAVQFLTPVFVQSAQAQGALLATRRQVIVFSHLADSWRTTGRWPATLPDLGEDSIDPFSHKPFIYRLTSDGFVLYSIGPDRVDDGGLFDKGTKDRVLGVKDGRLNR